MDGWFRTISFWVGFGGDLTASLLVSGRVPISGSQVGLGCNKIPLQQMDFHSLHASYGLGWNPGHSDSAARFGRGDVRYVTGPPFWWCFLKDETVTFLVHTGGDGKSLFSV